MRFLMATSALLLAAQAAAAPPPAWIPRAPVSAEAPDAAAPRDPFTPLVDGGSSDPSRGLAGMVLADLRLTGVTRTSQAAIATFENPATGAFFATPGDRLKDGVIVAIDAERGAVLIRQPDPGPSGRRDVVLELGRSR